MQGKGQGADDSVSRIGTNNGDKLDRWIGHMAHQARGIEFVRGCWVCGIGQPKKFPQKADGSVVAVSR